MDDKKKVIWRRLCDILPEKTSHGVGEKKVITSDKNVKCGITQIAYSTLHIGDNIEKHYHPTMDEHFFFLSGICEVTVVGNRYLCSKGDYLFIPATFEHSVIVNKETDIITVGISTC